MIHRVLLGSMERFLGILVEHCRGNFNPWLAPIQIRVLSISEKYNWYAKQIHERLSAIGIRSELDESSSTLSYNIRSAETEKIPYMVICGKREAETNTISVRKHGRKELGTVTLEELVKTITDDDIHAGY